MALRETAVYRLVQTEKRVENTTLNGVFVTKFEVFG